MFVLEQVKKRRTHPVLPAASTAGNGTQPLSFFKYGLYLRYNVPVTPLGTVSANPTTASCAMTARFWNTGAERTVAARPSSAVVAENSIVFGDRRLLLLLIWLRE